MTTSKIRWIAENVELPKLDYDNLEKWLSDVAQAHGKRLGNLTYIFCNDERIIEVNRQFLQHDYYTDIITFDDCIGRLLRGDMFISLDTVASNAQLVGETYNHELHRVIVHGLLHLCGINDKGPGEREIMEMHENEALVLLRGL
ncbi:MAG: rRNA maturation RNase YbeY [Muribaculaceae bacterium]|nr:rRNA maturation RNase YbeY [Muribaculaceae bacterium]MDE7393107.1 rRNA maturation RNase YbeY [Muribaculaceae bacterium]